MKIISTNWISLLGVFSITYLFMVMLTLIDANLSYNIPQALLAALFSILGYGIVLWGMFIFLLIALDIILIIPNKGNLRIRLLTEWIIVSSPFIFWIIKYHEWIFLVAIITFLVTQLLREKHILKVIDVGPDL